jgi:nucleotide-binding universal stress UspA family protein
MYQRILVPLDGSDTAHLALDSALALARTMGARLRLLHVVEKLAFAAGLDPAGGASASGHWLQATREAGIQVLDAGLAAARAAGVPADCLLHDTPGRALGETVAEAARLWQADLIVTGTHGRSGVGRLLLGSGAEQIIRLAPVPVLVVRATPSAGQEP